MKVVRVPYLHSVATTKRFPPQHECKVRTFRHYNILTEVLLGNFLLCHSPYWLMELCSFNFTLVSPALLWNTWSIVNTLGAKQVVSKCVKSIVSQPLILLPKITIVVKVSPFRIWIYSLTSLQLTPLPLQAFESFSILAQNWHTAVAHITHCEIIAITWGGPTQISDNLPIRFTCTTFKIGLLSLLLAIYLKITITGARVIRTIYPGRLQPATH